MLYQHLPHVIGEDFRKCAGPGLGRGCSLKGHNRLQAAQGSMPCPSPGCAPLPHAGIAGTGQMGCGIAQTCALKVGSPGEGNPGGCPTVIMHSKAFQMTRNLRIACVTACILHTCTACAAPWSEDEPASSIM